MIGVIHFKRGIFDQLRFRAQLALVFIVGILLLALATSIIVSRISSSIIEKHQVSQGMQVTESLARQSEIALLYQSSVAARDVGESAINFPGVLGITIETEKLDKLYDTSANSDDPSIQGSAELLLSETETIQLLADEPLPTRAAELSLIAEDDSTWTFSAPVFSSTEANDFELQSATSEKVLLGYITVVVTKETLNLMQDSTLRNNLMVSFLGACLLLAVLLYFSRRLTQPIDRLSAVMELAQRGDEKIRSDIAGPVDITHMQASFNRMMEVLEERREELQLAMHAALESARVKGEFAANVTHELRTPMNAVLGMLDLLLTMGLSLKQQEYVETAKSSGESLLSLIDEILDFSEADMGKLTFNNQDYVLEESLDSIVGLLSSTALKKKINIGYLIEENVPAVIHSDSAKIRQVLINLAGNAVKFTDSGEVSIHVSLDRAEGDQRMIDSTTSHSTHARLKFVVRDSGIGISPNDQLRIFDAFTQLDSSSTKRYPGTGLGLAISKQIVGEMGGEMAVSSELGSGSEFSFVVPVQISSSPKSDAATNDISGMCALFVSTSPIITAFAQRYLAVMNVQTTFVENGQDALREIRQCTSETCFDVVFIDQDITDIKIHNLVQFLEREPQSAACLVALLCNPWDVDVTVRELSLPRLNKPLRSKSFSDFFHKYLIHQQFEDEDSFEFLQQPTRQSFKILVVDDNRPNQQVAQAMLEKLGCTTAQASNGREAVEAVIREEFDAVFMDCSMPLMNGYDATAQIRVYEGDAMGSLPIIAMTANNSDSEKQRCKDAGMSDFLPKPLSLTGLREKLAQWVGLNIATAESSQANSANILHHPQTSYRPLSYDAAVVAALRETVGEVVGSMIEAFVEDTPVYLSQLRVAIDADDVQQTRELAHTIKGSAANFGALELVELSRELEERALQSDLHNAIEQVNKLAAAFDRLCDDLKQETSSDSPMVTTSQRNPTHSRILIVDDDRTTRMGLVDVFMRENYEVEQASNGMQALTICKRSMPELILMDAVMPQLNGFDACQMIREIPHGADIPVLMITSLEDETSIVRAFSCGATDYIAKPINFSVLKQRVVRLIKANRAEQHVKQLAYHDPLTGLPNRAQLKQQIRIIVNRAALEKQRFAILFLDLDRFKMINDTLGHEAGDLLLKAVADRIRNCVREQDFIARLGGDEFTIILENVHGPESAAHVAEKICRSVSQPFAFMQQKMCVTTSIGISIFPDDGEDVSALIKHADSAMFRAKEKRNHFCFYEQGMEAEIASRLKLEQELRKGIQENELVLYYQPQIDMHTGKLVGAEALVRWNHPTKGLVPPDVFIPLAEESGLINQLSDWVLKNGVLQLTKWLAQNHRLTLAINISVKDLMAEQLHTKLQRLIRQHNLPKNVLELEITEGTLMKHPEVMISELKKIKKMGISIAVDDFGSGYSSLNYLKRLPVDLLKIDRSFIRDIESDSSDVAIVTGIVALAKSLTLKTVAEGVETESQRAILQRLGCDHFQGYLFSKPLPADLFADTFLTSEKVI